MTDEELKRQAQIGMLKDPVSTTMPVKSYEPGSVMDVTKGTNPGVMGPISGAPVSDAGLWGKGEIKGGARQGADFARLAGGFGDANTDSMKHTFGRIAQNFEHTPQGLQALMADAEFKQLFPNATINKDWIDFGGQLDPHTGTKVGKIDVMRAWDPTNNGGTGWQWLTEDEAMSGGGTPAAGMPAQTTGALNPMADNSTLAKIMAELNAASSDEPSPAEREALFAALQGGL